MSSYRHNLKFVFDFESINRRISLQIASMMFLHDFGDGFDIALNNMKNSDWWLWHCDSDGAVDRQEGHNIAITLKRSGREEPVAKAILFPIWLIANTVIWCTSLARWLRVRLLPCLLRSCVVDHPTVAEFYFPLIFYYFLCVFSEEQGEGKIEIQNLRKRR